jgi:TonB family protein
MVLALAISVAVHGAILTARLGMHVAQPGPVSDSTPLVTELASPSLPSLQVPVATIEPEVAATPPPVAAPAPMPKRAPVAAVTRAEASTTQTRQSNPQANTPADLPIEGELLIERDRLGEALINRQINEFPAEIDIPVRLQHTIRVAYPADALAAGREGDVAVWIVVNALGEPEEIEVAAGAEEFAKAVSAAVSETRFLPAESRLRLIRYPIALQFRFQIHGIGQTSESTPR